jgi:hypothetical protein
MVERAERRRRIGRICVGRECGRQASSWGRHEWALESHAGSAGRAVARRYRRTTKDSLWEDQFQRVANRAIGAACPADGRHCRRECREGSHESLERHYQTRLAARLVIAGTIRLATHAVARFLAGGTVEGCVVDYSGEPGVRDPRRQCTSLAR